MSENNFSLTIIARIIGSIGIGVCVIILNVLMFDRKIQNFDNTRTVIQLFGFDWYDFESMLKQNGHFAFGILVTTVVVNLLINSLLILGTVMHNRPCTFPFLVMTVLLCVAKTSSITYNLLVRPQLLDTDFILSSVVYLVLLLTSWTCVYFGQCSWKRLTKPDVTRINATMTNATMNYSVFDSPGPYQVNAKYSEV
ncbi:hypothetical protein CBL_07797 [Carabus blaptoides fortunei]